MYEKLAGAYPRTVVWGIQISLVLDNAKFQEKSSCGFWNTALSEGG